MSATTAQALATALQPKTGMQRIALPLESYPHLSPPLSQKLLVNYYAEQEPSDARTAAALIPTGGLDPFKTVGGGNLVCGAGPVMAMNGAMPGMQYVVSGTHFYRLSQDVANGPVVAHDLGDIGTPSAADYPWNLIPTIACGMANAVVCMPPRAYACAHTDAAVTQLGGTFPGARSVTYLDGYYVFTSDENSTRFFSSLLNSTDFDALDFAYADRVVDLIHRVITLNGELWFFGDQGVQIWYDAGSSGLETTPGTSFFPFRPQSGGVIQHGVDGHRTIAVIDGSAFWVSQGMVMRSQGYKAQRISTHAIEQQILPFGPPGALCAFAFEQNGHSFYCLTYPNLTMVYDCATGLWHNRASTVGGQWLPTSECIVPGGNMFGGEFGTIMASAPYLDSDNHVELTRTIQTPPLWAGTRRAFMARLEIEIDLPTWFPPPSVLLEWSDDGCRTWHGSRTLYPNPAAGMRQRLYTTRLGSFRERVLRITTRGSPTIYAIDADITSGAS